MLVPPQANAATGLKFKSVNSEYGTTVALDNDGYIWAWGSNSSGQFGDGTTTSASTPRRIDVTYGGTPVTFQDVKTGWSGSTALDTSGHLWWAGDYLQDGVGPSLPGSSSWTKLPVLDGGTDVTFTGMARGRLTSFAIDSRDGSIWGWGRAIGDQPVKLPIADGGSPVAFNQISDNNEDAIALDTSNRIWNLYAVGLVKSKYVLNDGGGAPVDFRSISTGNGSGSSSSYMLHAAVDAGGQVWTWGENESGQLGDGGTTDNGTPTKRAIKDGGAPVAFDSVSAGERFVLGLDANGDIWSWGLNDQGQLGNGTKVNGSPGKLTVTDGGTPIRFKSVAAGYGRSYAIDDDGRIWTWGSGTLAPVRLTFAPSVTLSVSPASSSTKLQSVTLTATVTGDWETPTGTVQFKDGSTSLVTSVPLTGGIATWTTSALSVSTHALSASYSGDGNYTSQVSANVSHQVSMPAAPDLTLTPSTTSDTFDPLTVNISALANGSGNSLSLLKWLPGNKSVSDFAVSGTDVTVAKAFDAASNGTYTVYARDMAGNETVKTIDLTNILQAGNPAALNAAIATAEQALTDRPEGTGVGQAPGSARNALQTAIDAAQAVLDDAAKQTQAQLDAASATLNDAIAAFELTVVGVVLDVPASGLYGTNGELVFTLTYEEPVSVTGTPRLPIAAGTGSVTQSVYAVYTGAAGEPTKTLTFSYTLPEGMADEDGIQPASQLDLADGADVTFISDDTQAPLSFSVPDTSGIRLIGVAPELELAATQVSSSEAKVGVTATVYGERAAGNSLAKLSWMTGTRSVSEFANGSAGTSILASGTFEVTENGPYTVYARDAAGNEAVETITISSISASPDIPSGPRTTFDTSPDGGILVRIAPPDLVKEVQADGTVIDKVVLSDYLIDQIRDKLDKVGIPKVVLVIDDTEQTVKAEFPADKLGALMATFPDVLFETRLNGSSFELQASVLDLADLASRLGVDLNHMKVNIWASEVSGSTRTELERLAGGKGMKLIGQAVEFRITVSTGGRSLEVKDFGGTYMARAIVLEGIKEGGSYTAVVYDPGASSLSFVPAVIGTRSDDKKQMSMRLPHNSIYAIMETTKRSFDDLIGHWAKDDVELLAAKQIVLGVSDTSFAPNGKITRAEFLALLVRAMGLKTETDPTAQTFADVPANAWFAPEVAAGVKAGLASGVTEERFDPNAQVTREQMAFMLANALTLAGEPAKASGSNGARASFSDEEQISPWARSAAERIAAAGIMRGAADGRMRPEAFATRAEAAATLKRLLVAVQFIDH